MFKKLVLFLLFSIVILLSNLFNLNATYDWRLNTPPPCSINSDLTNWGKPKEFQICDIPDYPNCCFTVIYYERWTGVSNNELEFNLVGIFPFGGSNCMNYDKFIMLEWVWWRILPKTALDNSTNDNWKNKIMSTGRIPQNPGRDSWIYLYTTGRCTNINTQQPCFGQVCCRVKLEFTFGGNLNREIITLDRIANHWETPETQAACPPTCFPECFNYVSTANPDPCDHCKGAWDTELKHGDFSYQCCQPGCQSSQCVGCTTNTCSISYTYKVKKNPSPDCIYHDYELVDWSHCDGLCDNSKIPEIHAEVIQHMLKNGYFVPQNEGETTTDIRVSEAECYKPQLVTDNGGLKRVWAPCPGKTFCCQTIWDVINHGVTHGGLETVRKTGGTVPPYQNCIREITAGSLQMEVCHTFCDEMLVKFEPSLIEGENSYEKISLIKVTTIVKPNPVNNGCIISIKSEYQGNMTIKFRNVLGEIAYEMNFKKNSNEFEVQLELNKMPKGILIYQLYVSGIPVTESKKLVVE